LKGIHITKPGESISRILAGCLPDEPDPGRDVHRVDDYLPRESRPNRQHGQDDRYDGAPPYHFLCLGCNKSFFDDFALDTEIIFIAFFFINK
jgi:hypothetical protein